MRTLFAAAGALGTALAASVAPMPTASLPFVPKAAAENYVVYSPDFDYDYWWKDYPQIYSQEAGVAQGITITGDDTWLLKYRLLIANDVTGPFTVSGNASFSTEWTYPLFSSQMTGDGWIWIGSATYELPYEQSFAPGQLFVSGNALVNTGTHAIILYSTSSSTDSTPSTISITESGTLMAGDLSFNNHQDETPAQVIIADNGRLIIQGGGYDMLETIGGETTTLRFPSDSTRDPDNAFITAKYAHIKGNLVIENSPVYTGAGSATELIAKQQILIKTTGTDNDPYFANVNGEFDSVSVTYSATPNYIVGFTGKTADNRNYVTGYDLAWRGSTAQAHGTFTVAAGTTFNVDVPLQNRGTGGTGETFNSGWDGSSLTKRGAGTLVLSSTTNVTKMTVTAGVLRLTGASGTALHTVADIYVGPPPAGNGLISVPIISSTSVLHLARTATAGVNELFTGAVTLHLTSGNFIELNINVAALDFNGQLDAVLAELQTIGNNLITLTGWTGQEITQVAIDGEYDANERGTLASVLAFSFAASTESTGGSASLAAPLAADTPQNTYVGLAGGGDFFGIGLGFPNRGGSLPATVPVQPEPSTYALCGTALLAGLLWLRRRHRQHRNRHRQQ